MIRPAVLFFFSGALALVYEVLWQRRFALLFGGGATAAAIVLAACFAGMGVGSIVVSGLGVHRRPLRTYAVLEVLVAAGALLSFPLSSAAEGLRVAALAGVDSRLVRAAVETIVAMAALALPTVAMGGTLPVLARLADAGPRRLGRSAGLLYVANTVGAAAGALAVPLVLLPRLGAHGTLLAASAGSLAVAAMAWTIDARATVHVPARPSMADGPPPPWSHPAVLLAALSGVATLSLQVLWTRAFAQVHENSTHSFALVVALFVLALAAGGQLSRIALGRGREPLEVIGWAGLTGGVLVAAGPWLFLRLTGGMDYLPREQGWAETALRLATVAAAVLLPAVTAMGLVFPAVLEWAGRSPSAPASTVVGRVLASNVVGCVVGALLAGFVLPRAVGTWRGMLVSAALLAAGAAWCLMRSATVGRRIAIAATALALLVAGVVDWPRVRIVSAGGERLVALVEGADGVVAVVERAGSRRLKLNNHYVLGGTGSIGDERMQAHLPLLLHPAPRRVAMLGLGTGITAGAALSHPVERLTALELVPEVARAARAYFSRENAGVLDDPRTHLVTADARAYLRTTTERFDVIVGDLAVPWRPGEGALFTLEHFEGARRSLAADGLFCQWLPLFQLSEAELPIVFRTFLTVFPRAQVWRGDFSADEPALALVASATPMPLDPAVVTAAVRSSAVDDANPHIADPAGVWMYFAGVLEPADLPAGDDRLNREDRPWLELIGPWTGGPRRGITGRRLQAWLGDLRARDAGRLAALGPSERAAMEAGDWLFELSLALSEHSDERAQAAQAHLRLLLPPRTYAALFPALDPER